jgi:hypothetical protein
VTSKVDTKELCVGCRAPVLVIAGRSYLPGPLCRGCLKMIRDLEKLEHLEQEPAS